MIRLQLSDDEAKQLLLILGCQSLDSALSDYDVFDRLYGLVSEKFPDTDISAKVMFDLASRLELTVGNLFRFKKE